MSKKISEEARVVKTVGAQIMLVHGMKMNEDLVFRLRKRAEIRRSIKTRKSVQNNEPDRISDLLEEAANRIEELEKGGSVSGT